MVGILRGTHWYKCPVERKKISRGFCLQGGAADVLEVEDFFQFDPEPCFERRYAQWELEIRKRVRLRGGTAGVHAHLDFANKILKGVGVNGLLPSETECLKVCQCEPS